MRHTIGRSVQFISCNPAAVEPVKKTAVIPVDLSNRVTVGAKGLLHESLSEARRVARRRVVVKAVRWASTLSELGIRERYDSRSGKVAYGVLPGCELRHNGNILAG